MHGGALDGPVVANCSGVTAEALSVSCPLEIRRDGGAGAINSTRGHDLFLVAVDDGVKAMRRPQLQAAAATEDDAPPPTPASAVDWLQIK